MISLTIAAYTLFCTLGWASHAPARSNQSIHAAWVPRHCGPLRYPPLAVAANVEGAVLLQIEVDGTGRLRAAKVLQGSPILFNATTDNLKTCEFTRSSQVKAFSNESFVVYLFQISGACQSESGHCPTDVTYPAPGVIGVHTRGMPAMPEATGDLLNPGVR